MKTIALQSLGCRLNQAETESLTRRFLTAGYRVVLPHDTADIYLLNTCTVTSTSDGKCRKMLRAARRLNPGGFIVATGCYAERAGSELARLEGVDLVVGNQDKEKLVEIVIAANRRGVGCGPAEQQGIPGRTRALVKIQAGCSRPCSFCIVPRVRGKERSRPGSDIITEINSRRAEGYTEIVLTGTRIGSYADNGGLRELVSAILDQTDVPRLRLSSVEPADLTAAFLALWQNARLCRHLHLPLQSGSDGVLKRMGRNYSTADFEQAVSRAKEAIPDLALTTDVMVGFPGETDQEFEETCRFCEGIDFAGLHVFPYSARPGTRAAGMESLLSGTAKRERSRRLMFLAQGSATAFRQRFVGRSLGVLWEACQGETRVGHSDNYIKVFAGSLDTSRNSLKVTRLAGQWRDGLWGEPDPCVPKGTV